MSNFLYCIEAVGEVFGKIGVSRDPSVRICQFYSTAPFEFRFRKVLRFDDREVAYATERYIISSANRYRDAGEWVVIDDHLDNLLSGVNGADDVTSGFTTSTKGRRIVSPEAAELLLMKAKFAEKFGKTSKPKVNPAKDVKAVRAAIISERLAQGYGAEDVKVMDGIHTEDFWAVVNERRALRGAE